MTNPQKTSPKLFGTDGIRGPVGRFPLDPQSIATLGRAACRVLSNQTPNPHFVIGRDTRGSGTDIEKLLARGIVAESATATVTRRGTIPTPGLSYITAHGPADYGIMITASHNPYTDNGIKIFGPDGEKIPDHLEKEIEHVFYEITSELTSEITPAAGGVMTGKQDAPEQDIYLDFLLGHAPRLGKSNRAFPVVLDCAHGATYQLAPRIFERVTPQLTVTHAEPDGENINRGCGSTHMGPLKETLKTLGENALGIAFDGDGDRVLFMDHRGRLLDGDHTLYILTEYFLNTPQKDFPPIVVGTVMGNLGLENALKKVGVDYQRTAVGDKHVYRRMKSSGSVLGGEQSGHTILRSFQTTGDGILTALYFIKALDRLGIGPGRVFDRLELYPQETRNIEIREKKDLDTWDELNRMITDFNDRHGSDSRILIRYSGTEPRIRLMLESREQAVIDENIGRFADYIRTVIGAGETEAG